MKYCLLKLLMKKKIDSIAEALKGNIIYNGIIHDL